MSRTYNVIDSDGHVLEPPDFWIKYLDPKYRDRAQELFVDADRKERLRIEGRVYGSAGLGLAGAIGMREGAPAVEKLHEAQRYTTDYAGRGDQECEGGR